MKNRAQQQAQARKIQAQIEDLEKKLSFNRDNLVRMFFCKQLAQLLTVRNPVKFKKYIQMGLKIGHKLPDTSPRYFQAMCDLYRLKCTLFYDKSVDLKLLIPNFRATQTPTDKKNNERNKSLKQIASRYLTFAQKLNSNFELMEAHKFLGNCLINEAEDFFFQTKELGDDYLQRRRVEISFETKIKQAIGYIEEAIFKLDLWKKEILPEEITWLEYSTNLKFSLANAYMVYSKFDDKYLKKSLVIFIEILKKLPKPKEHQGSANLSWNIQKARNNAGLQYGERNQNVRLYCSILNNIALLYKDLEKFESSKNYFQKSLKVVQKKPQFWDEEIHARKQLANSFMILKEFSNSESTLSDALKLLRRVEQVKSFKDDPRIEEFKQDIYELTADCATEKQEYESYLRHFSKFKNLEEPYKKDCAKYKDVSIYEWIHLFEDMQSTGQELDLALIFENSQKNFKDELRQFIRYVMNNEIGSDPLDQLKLMNELISLLRGNKKLKSFSIQAFKFIVELYEWVFKETKNPNSELKLQDNQLKDLQEDYVYLLIDYSATLDDLEIIIRKIEELMVKAYNFSSSKLSDFSIVIKLLYYLEICYRGNDMYKEKAAKIARVFDKLEDKFEDNEKIVKRFFNDLDQFSGEDLDAEIEFEIGKKQKKISHGQMEEEGLKTTDPDRIQVNQKASFFERANIDVAPNPHVDWGYYEPMEELNYGADLPLSESKFVKSSSKVKRNVSLSDSELNLIQQSSSERPKNRKPRKITSQNSNHFNDANNDGLSLSNKAPVATS